MTQKNSSTWGEAFPEPAAPSDSAFLGPSTGAREGVGRKQVQTSPPELCYVTWVTAGGRRGWLRVLLKATGLQGWLEKQQQMKLSVAMLFENTVLISLSTPPFQTPNSEGRMFG